MFINETKRRADFTDFNPARDQVDTLFYKSVAGETFYETLLLMLSNGNATMERVFSVNRQIEVENMKESTYSAQHLVYDHLRPVGGIDNFVVTKALLQSASLARQRYLSHLEEQRRLKGAGKQNMKRKTLSDEIVAKENHSMPPERFLSHGVILH